MRWTVRYSTLSTLYYIACMLSLTLYTYLSMRTMEHDVDPLPGTRTLSALCGLVCLLSLTRLAWVKGYHFYRPSPTMIAYALFLLWVFVPTLLNDIESDTASDKITVLVSLLLPLSTLFITYNHLRNYGMCRWLGWFFCGMSLVYTVGYVQALLTVQSLGSAIQMIISYYTLYILPLILLSCGRRRSIFFVLLTFVLLLTSVKRGGLVALTAGLIAYSVTYVYTVRRLSRGALTAAVVLAALIIGGFVYVGTTGENRIIERFESIQSDEGSGRMTVWATTAGLISTSDALPLVVGHGYNKVVEKSRVGFSAHNDLLEVTYDYGVIGVVLYLCACCLLLRDILLALRRRRREGPVLALFFTVYFVLSMISHVIIYPWASIIMLTVGYFYALETTDARDE